MKAKKLVCIILAVVVGLSFMMIFSACGDKENTKVKVEMENGDTFIIELYPEYAPETAKNFEKLVKEGFYDGLTFHRISEGFMAQGGGYYPPGIDGAKKSSDSIKGEFSKNGFSKNTLKHTKGVISMARSDNFDSASSEFFIMYDTATHLDGNYAAFGKVIEGMETIEKFIQVEKIAGFAADLGQATIPVEPIIIKQMTIVN